MWNRVSLLATMVTLACFSPPAHRYSISDGFVGAPEIGRILLLPLNLAVQLPSELEPATRPLSDEIERYLSTRGLLVETAGYFEVRERWKGSMAEAEFGADDEAFFAAVRTLVARLGEERSFDAVVMPNLIYRNAYVRQVTGEVAWDGVKRVIETRGRPQVGHAGFHVTTDIVGTISGMSLHLFVFDRTGDQVFESRAGLDLAHYADYGSSVAEYEFRLKRRLLADDEALREGVALAFSPFLPVDPASVSEP